jgi:DNA-binding transcriptional regulator YhcF (GntR family)
MSDNILTLPRAKGSDGGHGAARPRKGAAKPSPFMINKQSAVPLHIQLKEQIRYAIMSGDYPPGSALPSIRELTAELGIHRNTVHRVYLELQAGGLLASRPGKGVFVNESLSDTVTPKELNAVEALIHRAFDEGAALGVSPVTLVKLAGQRAAAHDARHPVVAFVECTAHQSQECAKDLGESFGIHVQHLLLEHLRAKPCKTPPGLKHLVTSLFHYDEVKELTRKLDVKVHPVTYDLHPATRKLLRELPPERKLAFVCHDANTEEVIGAQILERVPAGVLVGCANLEAPELALALLKKVDTVILTDAASAFCIKNCTPRHELLELHFALNAASLDKVTRTILFQP